MILIDPITREEILLAKALGENVPDIVPIIRKEMYLAKIAGADIQTPKAITREEMYLDAIANGTEVTIEPITRKEMFYAKALGIIENAPEPITRIESLLNHITVGGGGGSYDKYSWEAVFASIKAGTYATDYAIGDMIPLDLGSEGIINMQIAAFDTDELADGSGKAHITWIAKELLKTKVAYKYKKTWSNSGVRTRLNDIIYPLLPESVRTNLVAVNKTSTTEMGSNPELTQDYLWIPSNSECASVSSMYGMLFGGLNENRKKAINGAVEAWFLRDSNDEGYAFAVSTAGEISPTWSKGTARAICLGFCT